jgi:hypothetical protein
MWIDQRKPLVVQAVLPCERLEKVRLPGSRSTYDVDMGPSIRISNTKKLPPVSEVGASKQGYAFGMT